MGEGETSAVIYVIGHLVMDEDVPVASVGLDAVEIFAYVVVGDEVQIALIPQEKADLIIEEEVIHEDAFAAFVPEADPTELVLFHLVLPDLVISPSLQGDAVLSVMTYDIL